MNLRLNPNESVDTIADRLALSHRWTAGERSQHVVRLHEIRRTMAYDVAAERLLVPLLRNPESLEVYLNDLNDRYEAACQILREYDDF
jgi:hypothetical protein